MSSQPSSSSHRMSQARGGWSTPKADPPPLPPASPRPKKYRVTVEPAKSKPEDYPVYPRRGEFKKPTPEQVVKKLTTTTEALSAEERQIVSGYRLSIGGAIAKAERDRMTKEMGL